MALHVPKAPGFAQMMKEGARHFSGLEEAVFRNITACKEFSQSVRSAYGPNGMNKMVINHIEKQFVTSDAATIMRELDVEHPAAKLMIIGSEMQDSEVGDGTNFVVILAGALLEAAEELLRLGVTPGEIADGYEQGLDKCLEILPGLICHEVKDCRKIDQVIKGISSSIQSKQYGNEDLLASLVAKACIAVLPNRPNIESAAASFNVDSVRVCKVVGGGLSQSEVLNGMVFPRTVDGDVTNVTDAKVALYGCAVDIMQTETKGTVLIKNADELMNFSRGEENLLELQIRAIHEAGAKVIVGGAKFGDMALHYINKYGMMAVRLSSKFDMRRLAKTVGGTVLPRLTAPTKEELGFCDSVLLEERGDRALICFRQKSTSSRISTILIRGATDAYLDDVERAIDDGVNTFKSICRDGRFLPGAGATEVQLSIQLAQYADTLPGLEQYAVRKFATALECFPKVLAENSGQRGNAVLTKLLDTHRTVFNSGKGSKTIGVDIEGSLSGGGDGAASCVCDAAERGILDLFLGKQWALKYAVNAASTILRVDQIIMAKRAGGPKARAPQGSDDES